MLSIVQLLLPACLASIAVAETVATSTNVGAAAAAPPSYFAKRDAVRNTGQGGASRIELRSPSHMDEAVASKRNGAAVLELVKRSQARALLSRQSQPSSNTSQSSSDNVNDKIQSLGFLDDSYYVPLNVSSNPSQMLFVSVDTGSSDLWFVSTNCTTIQCNDNRVLKFDQGASKSYQPLLVNSSANVSVTSSSNTTQSSSNSSSSGNSISRDVLSERALDKRIRSVFGAEATTRLFGASFAATPGANSTTVPFSVQYDDATTATGILGVDKVALADQPVANQVFGLVSATNLSLAQQGISGVLGMGFARGSAIARSLLGQDLQQAVASPLLSSILSTKMGSYPLFTLLLSRKGGQLTLGAADATLLASSENRRLVEWHDVVPFPSGNTNQPSNATLNVDAEALGQYVFWALQVSAAGFNGTSVNMTPSYTQVGRYPLALIDSGTAGIVGPYGAVSSLFSQIEGARHVGSGRYVVPCTTQERMFFSFGGGRNFTLLPSDYIIGPAEGNPYLCFAWPAAAQGSADGIDWILGQAFLRSVYSLFSLGIADREAPKIGFYPLNVPAQETSAASIFALQPSGDVASYVSQATPILTTLPNSLVPLITSTSQSSYYFSNATTTATPGLKPTGDNSHLNYVPPSTYQPVLTASTGDANLPILSSGSSALPLPSNPAVTAANGAAATHAMPLKTSPWTFLICLFSSVLVLTTVS